MEPEQKTSNYTIPFAIVIAGVLIAGSVLLTKQPATTPSDEQNNQPNTELSRSAIDLPPVTNKDHILGNPKADIVIVEYSDTECPFCKNFHETMHNIIDDYGKEGEVAWVYRHFPLVQLHSKAPRQAEATECAAGLGGNDVFWKYIDRIFEITPSNNGLDNSILPDIAEEVGLDRNQFTACLEGGKYRDQISASVEEAQSAGGRGTPYSVMVMKEELSIEKQNFISSATVQLPPGSVIVSDDKKRIALGGALPEGFIRLILDTLLEKTDDSVIQERN